MADCNSSLSLCVRGGEFSHDGGCPTDDVQFLGSIGGDSVTFTDTVGDKENPVVQRFDILPTVRFFVCNHLHALVVLILT